MCNTHHYVCCYVIIVPQFLAGTRLWAKVLCNHILLSQTFEQHYESVCVFGGNNDTSLILISHLLGRNIPWLHSASLQEKTLDPVCLMPTTLKVWISDP